MKIVRLWLRHSIETMRVVFAVFMACLIIQVGVACLNFVFGWSINLLSLGDDALSVLGAVVGIFIGLPLFGWAFRGVYKALHAEGAADRPMPENEK